MRGVTAMSSGTSCWRGLRPRPCASRRSPRVCTRFTGRGPRPRRIAEARGELFKLDDAARLGFLVDAVERRNAEIFNPDGHALVGGEHELLDEAVGPGALGAGDAAHFAVLIELDDGLGKIEIDRSALFAALVHEDGELFHALEVRHQCGVARPRFGVALKNCMDFRIGHARGGADDAFDDFEAFDAAGGIELHDATEHEAVFVRAKAADVCGELLRQHGDGAIGKVDTVAAQTGFEIKRGVGLDIFGHVGDVDLKLVASIGAIGDEDGVIEVAGGLAVDGDDGQARESRRAAGDRCLVEMGDGASFGEDMLGKDARQLVLADHHFHVNAKIIGSPEDFDHAANGGTRGRGPTGDLDVDDQAVALRASGIWTRERLTAENPMRRGRCGGGRDFRAGRDDDGLGHALVEGNDNVLPVTATGIGVMKRADDGGVAALQNPKDTA